MNKKTINDYINRLHLDKNKEDAIRKLINSIGTSSGIDENIPFDAPTDNDILKVYNEEAKTNKYVVSWEFKEWVSNIYIFDMLDSYDEDTYNKLNDAVNNNKIIIFANGASMYGPAIVERGNDDTIALSLVTSNSYLDNNLMKIVLCCTKDNIEIKQYDYIVADGAGSNYLADNGEYKKLPSCDAASVAENADLTTLISAYNNLITGLKTAGYVN